jgi:integral membrane sensor domain MASE1/anti-sigma regulatory factor (Ser/Thr protein kinase)
MSCQSYHFPLPARDFQVLIFAAIYAGLAAVSLSTAYLQVNAAAVWMPSGFALGLLLARGNALWPAVTIGSFLANLWVNIHAPGDHSLLMSTLVATCIAIANTAEALIGSYLANRLAGGAKYFRSPRDVAMFVSIVAPIPPVMSTVVGLAVSRIGGFAYGSMQEIMLTWYVANTVGILVMTGLTLILLSRRLHLPTGRRAIEALALFVLLVFFGQAICGIYVSEPLNGWPKAYMVIPLLLWASTRFGQTGAQLSLALIAIVSVIGTMRGYQAFPADTPSRSLIYLQIFLGILSVMALSISSAITMANNLRATLEDRVRRRTRDVERLLREREVFTALVAHDLRSPIFGVRNALRAAGISLRADRIDRGELVEAMGIMEDTCTTLAQRVAGLLDLKGNESSQGANPRRLSLGRVMNSISAAHRLAMEEKSVSLRFVGDMLLEISRPAELEHILDILIDNAVRFAPRGSEIEVAAFRHGGDVEIQVSDRGRGLTAEQARAVFTPGPGRPRAVPGAGSGLGLYLASEHAAELGGRLTYAANNPTGARFRLVMPT